MINVNQRSIIAYPQFKNISALIMFQVMKWFFLHVSQFILNSFGDMFWLFLKKLDHRGMTRKWKIEKEKREISMISEKSFNVFV